MKKRWQGHLLAGLLLTSFVINSVHPTWAQDAAAKENAVGRPFDANRRTPDNSGLFPEIISVANPDGSFDVAWRDAAQPAAKIYLTKFVASGAGYQRKSSEELESLGVLAGFTKDAKGNFYYMTAEPAQGQAEREVKIYRNKTFWRNFEVQDGDGPCSSPKMPLDSGSSQIAVGAGKLMVDINILPAHAYNLILDLDKETANNGRCGRETLWHHNFDNRIMFDGQDFVALENRDHEVTLSMMKFSPTEKYPFEGYAERLRSVYTRTNNGNSIYTEIGQMQPGVDNGNGYLVLFTSERDWDNQMAGLRAPGQQTGTGGELGPRDVAVIHVKKDFDKQEVNWKSTPKEREKDGNIISQAPKLVDTTGVVNSLGTGKTVNYQAKNDGWDWPNYSPDVAALIASGDLAERAYKTGGVNWLTEHGVTFENARRFPAKAAKEGQKGEPFKSATRAKLVRLAANNYVAVWEEHTAQRNHEGGVEKIYSTTKAMLLTLAADGANVRITKGAVKDLGRLRLNPNDDAINLGGKAAWVTGDQVNYSLKLHTIDAALNYQAFDLPVWDAKKVAELRPAPEIGFFVGNEFQEFTGSYTSEFPANAFFVRWRFKQGFLWHPDEIVFKVFAPDGKPVEAIEKVYDNVWSVDVGNNDRGQGRFRVELWEKTGTAPLLTSYFVRGKDSGK